MKYIYYKRKNKIKYFLLSSLIAGLIISSISFLKSKKTIETTYTPEEIVAENTIKNGIMKTTYNYVCNHSEVTENEIPLAYIGKTVEYIKSKYNEIQNIIYENNILDIEINKDVKCDKHYKVKLVDNELNVYCEKFPDKPENVIKINLIGLYEDEVELLKSGIEFGTKESMLEFLQDFES